MSERDNRKKPSDFIEFYMGIISMAMGIFFLLSKSVVRSGFYSFSVAGLSMSSGIVVIPLMIGILWLVNNPKSMLAKLITIAGSVFIIASIIMNIRITFTTTSLFDYVVMMILLAVGIGLIIKSNNLAKKE